MRTTNSQEWLERDHREEAREMQREVEERFGDPGAHAAAINDPRYVEINNRAFDCQLERDRDGNLRTFLLMLADYCRRELVGGGEKQKGVVSAVLKGLQKPIEEAKRGFAEQDAELRAWQKKREVLLKLIMEGK